MTDSSGSVAGFDDIPPSALTASHLVTDHDVAALIARGHNLLRRSIQDRDAVSRLVIELAEWSAHNRELLAKRFVDRVVADMYAANAEPFVVPTEAAQVEVQVDLLHRQLRHQVEWLERLRLTIPERQQPDTEPRLRRRRTSPRSVAVLATTASPAAASVVGAVARATGILPVVVEDHPGEERSLLRAAERTVQRNAVAVVVLEPPEDESMRPSPSSLLALGYAGGALGVGNVIAVCAPGLARTRELADFSTVMMDRGDGWRHQLEALLTQAGFTPTAVVSELRRS
jgi:hypothetical protein